MAPDNQLNSIVTDADLEALCANAVAEGLQIEFKEKEDPTTAVLSKSEKNIAQALSSFANSGGGTKRKLTVSLRAFTGPRARDVYAELSRQLAARSRGRFPCKLDIFGISEVCWSAPIPSPTPIFPRHAVAYHGLADILAVPRPHINHAIPAVPRF